MSRRQIRQTAVSNNLVDVGEKNIGGVLGEMPGSRAERQGGTWDGSYFEAGFRAARCARSRLSLERTPLDKESVDLAATQRVQQRGGIGFHDQNCSRQ